MIELLLTVWLVLAGVIAALLALAALALAAVAVWRVTRWAWATARRAWRGHQARVFDRHVATLPIPTGGAA